MKTWTETVTRREGEWLPLDHNYDVNQNSGTNPDLCARGMAALIAAGDGKGWMYRPSGWSSFRVLHVGMWDGWPFWKPTPALGYRGPMGECAVAFYYRINPADLYRSEETT